jgi:hypothetical protein
MGRLSDKAVEEEDEHAENESPALPCRPIKCPEESKVPVKPEIKFEPQSIL